MSTIETKAYVDYGTAVSSLNEMKEKCSPIDCLARMLMGEARGESELGQRACAYVVRNRQLSGKTSEFGGPDYKSIVTKGDGAQFNGILSSAAFAPKNYSEWSGCLDVASNFTNRSNPIGKCLWFVTNEMFNTVTTANGGKYKFPGGIAKKVTSSYVIGGHTFFTLEGYEF